MGVDPLRHLKRIRNRTPSRSSLQSSQTNIFLENREQVTSKLEETTLLKENCYDPEKYYSQQCEDYLRSIGYARRLSPEFQKKISPHSGPQLVPQANPSSKSKNKTKTVESEDYLKEVLFSQEKKTARADEDVQVLTFKKLSFEEQLDSNASKRPELIQRQLEFDLDPFEAPSAPHEGQ
jgi:hypothetical protein